MFLVGKLFDIEQRLERQPRRALVKLALFGGLCTAFTMYIGFVPTPTHLATLVVESALAITSSALETLILIALLRSGRS